MLDLIYGGGRVDRTVPEVESLLAAFTPDGRRYLAYSPITPRDRLLPEDLAVTILINSRVGWRAFISVQDRGPHLDLSQLPGKPLESTSPNERAAVAKLIAEVASWPGFGASVTSKVLHKKRPDLIPILDNQAIFGAYMNPNWPSKPSMAETVKAQPRILEALEWIAYDLTRKENEVAWTALQLKEPSRSRIDLFDMVWWTHFRQLEPVPPSAPKI
jgi:hypothetical protein